MTFYQRVDFRVLKGCSHHLILGGICMAWTSIQKITLFREKEKNRESKNRKESGVDIRQGMGALSKVVGYAEIRVNGFPESCV